MDENMKDENVIVAGKDFIRFDTQLSCVMKEAVGPSGIGGFNVNVAINEQLTMRPGQIPAETTKALEVFQSRCETAIAAEIMRIKQEISDRDAKAESPCKTRGRSD